ncbi:ribonuclease H-like domain-containing protein [Tanacetum coccineum]|uniref:Ribonuclease H-like domain-containing protein n=1 Tax=Tanacetum coccineum TaxID=301880 RepID=A0ABQ4X104_9ASTR
MVTRAKARISKPLALMNFHATTTSPIPRSHLHALRDLNWHKAMVDVYDALISNGTWALVPRPANVNIVRFMWLFKHKFNADGSLSSYKARLVANGCSQRVLCMGLNKLLRHGFNGLLALLHVSVFSIVCVCFQQFTYLLLYVDDIILTASSTTLLQRISTLLHSVFAMTDLGLLNYFYGISAQRSKCGLFLCQSKFVEEILERAHMQHCNPCKTPVDTKSKLDFDGNPVSDPTLYCSLAVCGTIDHGLQLPVSPTSQLLKHMLIGLVALLLVGLPLGVANVAAKTAWIRNVLLELHAPLFTATLNMLLPINFVYFMSLLDFSADIFTEGLPTALFLEFRSSLNVRRPPAPTAREY